MAIEQFSTSVLQYYGLSTDTKPTPGPREKATFTETDTEDVYRWSGASWTKTEYAGAIPATLLTRIAGEANIGSAISSYLRAIQSCNITICDGTSAVTIGSGAANDTRLMGILIKPAATPVTATIAGFTKKTDAGVEAAGSIVVTGRDSDLANGDLYIDFKGALNDAGALTVTASVDEAVTVFWWPA